MPENWHFIMNHDNGLTENFAKTLIERTQSTVLDKKS